jgi:hypothetical protein
MSSGLAGRVTATRALVRLCCLVAVFAVVLAFASTSLLAQSQASSGEIAGTVKDGSGAVIPNVKIEVINANTGFKQMTTTNGDGMFRAVLLPAGSYKVTATAANFAPSTGAVEVGVGRTMDLNLVLGVAARKEEVTVSAEFLEVTRHEQAAFVGATVVSNIPLNGRRFQDVATITPTIQVEPSRNQISMSGQRGVNSSIQVDGADYGQLFFGGIRGGERSNFAPTIPLDAIQEFQIVRAGYSAEFGRSTGGTISAVSKSGTNDIHGAGNYVIRHEALAKSTEYYDTIRQSLAATCPNCTVNPNPTLQQWGGSLGGPVKKDKLFFFGAYDQQRQRIPHQVLFDKLVGFNPTAVQSDAYNLYKSLETPYEQTNDAWLFSIKGDYNINQHNRLSVRYNQNNYQGLNATSTGSGIAPTITNALSNNGTELDRAKTVVGTLTTFFTHVANEARFQYAHESRPRNANVQQPTVGSTIGTYGTVNFLGQNEEHDYRHQAADNVTWIRGNHTVKFGGEFNYIFAGQTFGFGQHGEFNFSGVSDAGQALCIMSAKTGTACPGVTGAGTSGALRGRYDTTSATYNHALGNFLAEMSGQQVGAFLQDSWRVTRGLTVNYGLRWEGQWNSQPAANNAMVPLVNGFAFPSGYTENVAKIPNQPNQFAPRVGFAWDPWKNGKTVVRGFGGVYYAATPLLVYAGPINNFREPAGDLRAFFPITNSKLTAATVVPGCPSPCTTVWSQLQIVGINLNSYSLDKMPELTTAQVKTIAGTINAALGLPFNPYAGAAPISVDGKFANPRSYQGGGGIEHEVARGLTVGVDGTWIKTVHLERNRELNIFPAACVDLAGRPIYRLTGSAPAGCSAPAASRPQSVLGSIQVRDSSAESLFRSMTLRTSMKRTWGEINAYYTLSENVSNDDNERDSGGVKYVDSFNFAPEYNYSNLDRKHQFVLSPVIYLPWKFQLSSAMRFLSGNPVDVSSGTDSNQDRVSNDRPYWSVGQIFKRNAFRNRELTFVDLRVQKAIPIHEKQEITISAEFFNLFNVMNLTYSGSTVTNYCKSASQTCGIGSFLNAASNGWSPNADFLQLREQNSTASNFGKLLTTNNSTAPFETQFTIRYRF